MSYEALDQLDLDEAVHERKAQEAADINNAGRDAQLAYLDGDVNDLNQARLLEAAYVDATSWGSGHPLHTFREWGSAAAAGETRLGYWDWVAHNVESASSDEASS